MPIVYCSANAESLRIGVTNDEIYIIKMISVVVVISPFIMSTPLTASTMTLRMVVKNSIPAINMPIVL